MFNQKNREDMTVAELLERGNKNLKRAIVLFSISTACFVAVLYEIKINKK